MEEEKYTTEQTPGGLFVWSTCRDCGARQFMRPGAKQIAHNWVYTTPPDPIDGRWHPSPCPNEGK